jgi:hypothetical protein
LNRPRPTQGCRVVVVVVVVGGGGGGEEGEEKKKKKKTTVHHEFALQRVTQQIINIIYKFCNVSITQYAANDQQSAHQGIGQSNNALAHSSQLVQHFLAKYKIPHVQQLPHSPVLSCAISQTKN